MNSIPRNHPLRPKKIQGPCFAVDLSALSETLLALHVPSKIIWKFLSQGCNENLHNFQDLNRFDNIFILSFPLALSQMSLLTVAEFSPV